MFGEGRRDFSFLRAGFPLPIMVFPSIGLMTSFSRCRNHTGFCLFHSADDAKAQGFSIPPSLHIYIFSFMTIRLGECYGLMDVMCHVLDRKGLHVILKIRLASKVNTFVLEVWLVGARAPYFASTFGESSRHLAQSTACLRISQSITRQLGLDECSSVARTVFSQRKPV